jgi:hypothetical protein
MDATTVDHQSVPPDASVAEENKFQKAIAAWRSKPTAVNDRGLRVLITIQTLTLSP